MVHLVVLGKICVTLSYDYVKTHEKKIHQVRVPMQLQHIIGKDLFVKSYIYDDKES